MAGSRPGEGGTAKERGSQRPGQCISDLKFDEWDAGELGEDQVVELEHHIAGCPTCASRQGEVQAAAQEFLDRSTLSGKSLRGAVRPGRGPVAEWAVGTAVAVAVAAVTLVLLRPDADTERTGVEGEGHIGFFVERGGRAFAGTHGEQVRPGDRLRFFARLDRARHVAILRLNSRGEASVHPSGNVTRSIGPGTNIALGHFELDDAVGEERVFALLCARSVVLADVRTELERTRKLDVDGCTTDVIRLSKLQGP